MTRFEKTVCLLLVLSLLLPCGGCGKKGEPDAVILLPGITGSRLFAAETFFVEGTEIKKGSLIWEPGVEKLDDVLTVNTRIRALSYSAAHPITAGEPCINEYDKTEGGYKYGAIDTYRDAYNKLYAEFCTRECDVVFYEYDWREDPYESAKKLDAFINSRGYQSVVFVGHSMGGIVTSHYISLGELQRSRVNKFISVAAPFCGSVSAGAALISGDIDVPVIGFLLSGSVKDVVCDIPAIYSLLPTEAGFCPWLEESRLDSVRYSDYEATTNALASVVEGFDTEAMRAARENMSRLFTKDGHASALVDTYRIIGYGEETTDSVDIIDITEDGDVTVLKTKDADGDGTVGVQSASYGAAAERCYYKSGAGAFGAEHKALIDGEDATTLGFIALLIRGEQDDISTEELYATYGIKRSI